jgi:hypothetical protein
MTNIELVQGLIDDTNKLPHRDGGALDKLKKRGKMILDKVCPGKRDKG